MQVSGEKGLHPKMCVRSCRGVIGQHVAQLVMVTHALHVEGVIGFGCPFEAAQEMALYLATLNARICMRKTTFSYPRGSVGWRDMPNTSTLARASRPGARAAHGRRCRGVKGSMTSLVQVELCPAHRRTRFAAITTGSTSALLSVPPVARRPHRAQCAPPRRERFLTSSKSEGERDRKFAGLTARYRARKACTRRCASVVAAASVWRVNAALVGAVAGLLNAGSCGRCGRSWRLAAAGLWPALGSIRAVAARRAIRSLCRCSR